MDKKMTKLPYWLIMAGLIAYLASLAIYAGLYTIDILNIFNNDYFLDSTYLLYYLIPTLLQTAFYVAIAIAFLVFHIRLKTGEGLYYWGLLSLSSTAFLSVFYVLTEQSINLTAGLTILPFSFLAGFLQLAALPFIIAGCIIHAVRRKRAEAMEQAARGEAIQKNGQPVITPLAFWLIAAGLIAFLVVVLASFVLAQNPLDDIWDEFLSIQLNNLFNLLRTVLFFAIALFFLILHIMHPKRGGNYFWAILSLSAVCIAYSLINTISRIFVLFYRGVLNFPLDILSEMLNSFLIAAPLGVVMAGCIIHAVRSRQAENSPLEGRRTEPR